MQTRITTLKAGRLRLLPCLLAFAILPTTDSSINLPQQLLPVYGGPGGDAFSRSCGAGKVLTGLRGRVGLVVDAVGLLCRPVNSDGTLGSETTVGTHAGGGGGNTSIVRCRSGQVVAGAEIFFGTFVNSFVNGIRIRCFLWTSSARQFGVLSGNETLGNYRTAASGGDTCESVKQPVVGIRGRAKELVDAIGFICDEP